MVLEILLALDADWFAGPIGYVGLLTVPLVGGVFPMLLVAAARRKGEYVPARILGLIGRPVTVAVVGGLFLTAVFLHGMVIWQEPLARAAALVVGIATVGLVVRLVLTGRFRPRSIVEVRLDDAGHGWVSVTSDGREVQPARPYPGAIVRGRPVQPVTIRLEPGHARELRIWSHQVSAEGWSSIVPAGVTIIGANGHSPRVVEPSKTDPLLFPFDGSPVEVTVRIQPVEGTV